MAENEEVGFLDGEAGAGVDTIRAGDLSRSFLKLAQPLTPEVTNNKIENLKLGDFFSPLAGTSFGPCVELIVLKQEHLYNIWKPQRGGLVSVVPVDAVVIDPLDASAANGKIAAYTTKDKSKKLIDSEGNDVVESYNLYVIVVGHEDLGPLILPFQSTGIKHARAWLTKLASMKSPSGKPAAIFQGVWRVQTVKNIKGDQVWYGIGDKSVTNLELVSYICGTYVKADGTEVPGLWTDTEAKEKILPLFKICKDMDGAKAIMEDTDGQKALPAGQLDPSLA